MVDSSVAVGGGLTGSSSSSVAEWKLSSSLGGAGESSVVESLMRELLGGEVCDYGWHVCDCDLRLGCGLECVCVFVWCV